MELESGCMGVNLIRKKTIISILIIVIIIIFCYYLSMDTNEISSENNNHIIPTTIIYEINISATINNSYSINIPIPTDGDRNVIKDIVNNLTIIQGQANFSVVETEKGHALNLLAKGGLVINSNISYAKGYFFDMMSMQNGTDLSYKYIYNDDVKFWVYFESDTYNNISIEIKCKSKGFGFTRETEIKSNILSSGWNLIDGTEYSSKI